MKVISKRRQALLVSTMLLPASWAGAAFAQAASADNHATIEEVVVTATRQEQVMSRVPVSVSAFSQQRMDSMGVKQVDDLMRMTPGVTMTRSSGAINNSGNLSIRGIASSSGAATTGVYIDDTPIQTRVIGGRSENAYPTLFDLERIEVLRGPQGTLFGAGSQGGTVRFITPQPSLTRTTGYGRTEVATTQNGGISYEAGYAMGGPIVADKLGFRASAFFRHSGGYLDRIQGVARVVNPTGTSGPASVAFTPTGIGCEDCNWDETKQVRVALKWAPTEYLEIVPSFLYQKSYANDYTNVFWPVMSNYKTGDFKMPQWVATVDAGHVPLINAPDFEPAWDKLTLSAVQANWDIGAVQLVSNTAYFQRRQETLPDFTALESRNYGQQVPAAGNRSTGQQDTKQANFTQELRLQSSDPSSRFNWVAGVFYTRNEQQSYQGGAGNNFLGQLPMIRGNQGAVAVAGGAPFGPGYSAYVNFFGVELSANGQYPLRHWIDTQETQLAAFGQVDFKVTEKLKLTAGLRVAKNEFKFHGSYYGGVRNLNQPNGRACVPNTGVGNVPCQPVAVGQYRPGEGPFAPMYFSGGGAQKESPVTPKFAISYQADESNLYYASAAKGYRIGGAQDMQPSTCNAELIQLGYVDSSGRAASPATFNSDTVWSYEAGAKNRLFGNRLQLESSAYYIAWKDVPSRISLNTCGRSFTDNVGDATSMGVDVSAQFRPISPLLLGVAVSYNDTTWDQAIVLNQRTVYTEGSPISEGASPWTVVVSAQYDFTVLEGTDAYVRADYTYSSELGRSGTTDPGSVTYDALVPPRGDTYLVNARAGLKLSQVDLSLFATNLTNETPSLGYGRQRGQSLYWDTTWRPRTVGMMASYRY